MSRRDKQADLRRRMAKARAKLVSTQTTAGELDVAANANSVIDDAPSSTTIGKKRPLPPSSSSGGGILRKPKYNTNPAAAIESNNAPSLLANISMKEDDGQKMNKNALGSLMADYSSSDDDDDKDNNNSAATKHPEPSSYDEIQNNDIHIQGEKHTDNEPTVNNSTTSIQIPAKKKKKKSAAPAQLESTHIITKQQPKIIDEGSGLTSTQFNGKKNELLMGETAKLKATEGEEKETSKSTTEVSDEVWDEFNALLDDDEGKANAAPSTAVKDDQPLKSEEINASTTETDDSTKKKSKKEKKKKKKKQPKDMYDNTEMNNVIQASYEGRLGRLMLLKSKKASSSSKHQNNKKGENGMEDNDIAQEEFYDGGLAFQHDDDGDGDDHDNDEDDTRQLETGVESTTTATISTQKSGESDSRADTSNLLASSAADAQPISLANILRNRRDKARQLSRGQNDDARKEDNEVEDEDDGRWF